MRWKLEHERYLLTTESLGIKIVLKKTSSISLSRDALVQKTFLFESIDMAGSLYTMTYVGTSVYNMLNIAIW